jgi:hypothetical protein
MQPSCRQFIETRLRGKWARRISLYLDRRMAAIPEAIVGIDFSRLAGPPQT